MSIPTGSRVPLRNTMAGRGAVHEVAHISQVSSIDSSIANESLVGLRRAIVNNRLWTTSENHHFHDVANLVSRGRRALFLDFQMRVPRAGRN